MNSLIQLKKVIPMFLIALVLACLALLPNMQAVSPPPDGGYPGENTAEGDNALFSLAPNGVRNTAIGSNALSSNTGGGANTAVGASALANNTANDNTACGSYTMAANTTGSGNTAFGIDALMLNINGNSNHASGHDALFHNTSGSNNTANGANTLFNNTTGINNTANGANALFSNTTGTGNVANGVVALKSNTSASNNTANGQAALRNNTTGDSNTADGFGALLNNTTGGRNIAVGSLAGASLTTGSNDIDIGNGGVAGESNTMRIGNVHQTATFIAGISGAAVTGASVMVNAAGQLGTPPSAGRFKDEIKAMGDASEGILALKPVSFRYKKEIDPERAPQFGLIAEDVAKVNPDLVARDAKGELYTVRYDAVNAMLLNEFLKEHRKMQSLEKAVAEERKENAAIRAMLKEQAAQIQKVRAQLEVSKRAPQVAENNQ